jgi:hypothetical protein
MNENGLPVKKRGRPSKKLKEKQLPKKRGRKPKQLSTTAVPIDNDKTEEPIILHLPIKNFNDNENNLLQYNPTLNEPTPNIDDNVLKYELLRERNNSLDDSDIKLNIIDNLENEITDIINNYDEEYNKLIIERNEKIKNNIDDKYVFLDSKQNCKWPLKTSCFCFWDCHPFTNSSFGLPIKRDNKNIYMFGHFCSPECVAAYNFDLDDGNNMWERYSMINELYSINEPIKTACSKLMLENFGGKLSIKEFRKMNINNSKTYTVTFPPVISHTPNMEETIIDVNYNYIKIDNELNKTIDGLKLKRNKSVLNGKSTLENTMNLKFI